MVRSRSLLATVLAVAYVTCPLVEPLPNGLQPAEPWWLAVLGLASVTSIVVAVAAVARGTRRAGRLTVLAGLGMFGMTASCPLTGHHVTGWWTWWQAGMSAFVLLSGVAIGVLRAPARGEPWAAGPVDRSLGHLDRPLAVLLPAPREARVPDVVATRGRRRAGRPEPVRPAAPRAATRPAQAPERAAERAAHRGER